MRFESIKYDMPNLCKAIIIVARKQRNIIEQTCEEKYVKIAFFNTKQVLLSFPNISKNSNHFLSLIFVDQYF
jgi:hypothetical protein